MVLRSHRWGAVSLGIFVEGQSDRSTIPILIRKLGHGLAVHTRVVGQGDMLKETEMSNQIAALRTLHPRLAKILVFMDSEGVDPGETLRLAKPVEARLNRMSGRATVTYIVVDHSLEGWLACDERALRAVLGRGARIRIRGSPEDDLRPAPDSGAYLSGQQERVHKDGPRPEDRGSRQSSKHRGQEPYVQAAHLRPQRVSCLDPRPASLPHKGNGLVAALTLGILLDMVVNSR